MLAQREAIFIENKTKQKQLHGNGRPAPSLNGAQYNPPFRLPY
jgi:hypothetical protein